MGYNLETASSHLATKRGGVCLKVKQHGRKDQRCEIERAREREREVERGIFLFKSPCPLLPEDTFNASVFSYVFSQH